MNRLKRSTALVLLLLVSCAAQSIHPGAVNRQDSAAYDVLLVSQAVIEQARTEDAGGQLHASLKAPLNRLIESYNLARAGWLTYRAAVKASTPADVATLKRQIDAVSVALQAFSQAKSIP